jgi:hypothetical protein
MRKRGISDRMWRIGRTINVQKFDVGLHPDAIIHYPSLRIILQLTEFHELREAPVRVFVTRGEHICECD